MKKYAVLVGALLLGGCVSTTDTPSQADPTPATVERAASESTTLRFVCQPRDDLLAAMLQRFTNNGPLPRCALWDGEKERQFIDFETATSARGTMADGRSVKVVVAPPLEGYHSSGVEVVVTQ